MMSDTEDKVKQEKEDPFEFTGKDEKCDSDHSSTGSPLPPGANEDGGKKSKTEKKKRKRLLKDVNAPKAPLSGYVRFLNEHREKYREDHPELAFHEITKILGQKWSSMNQEEKQEYLDQAEKEREKYAKLKEGYQQSAAYKEFQQLKKRKEAEDDGKEDSPPPVKTKKEDNVKLSTPKCNGETTPATTASGVPESVAVVAQGPKICAGGAQIPIFTEQFLEYSRKREADLRQLRKHNSGYEEQNAILNKQIDHMKTVMERVKSEIIEQERENSDMHNYLEKIRNVLAGSFGRLSYPDDIKEQMMSDTVTIDKKLSQLVEYISNSKSIEASEMKKKVKELVSNLDYPALKK